MKTVIIVQFCANRFLKIRISSVVDEKSETDATFQDCFLVHHLDKNVVQTCPELTKFLPC